MVVGGKQKKYLHREVIKKELGLTDTDLKGLVIHHINENKDDNDINNLEILTQSEHMKRHKNKYDKNLSLGRVKNKHLTKKFIKNCEICGIVFETYAHNAKYCSNACKMKNYRSNRK